MSARSSRRRAALIFAVAFLSPSDGSTAFSSTFGVSGVSVATRSESGAEPGVVEFKVRVAGDGAGAGVELVVGAEEAVGGGVWPAAGAGGAGVAAVLSLRDGRT